MAVTCGIFHYLAPGASCCLCLRIVLLYIFFSTPAFSHSHIHTESFSLYRTLCVCVSLSLSVVLFRVNRWGASACCLLCGPAVWGTFSDGSPLHGLSCRRPWLLHRGYHPPQDQPPQPGRSTLLPMGEEGGGVCVCVCECVK